MHEDNSVDASVKASHWQQFCKSSTEMGNEEVKILSLHWYVFTLYIWTQISVHSTLIWFDGHFRLFWFLFQDWFQRKSHMADVAKQKTLRKDVLTLQPSAWIFIFSQFVAMLGTFHQPKMSVLNIWGMRPNNQLSFWCVYLTWHEAQLAVKMPFRAKRLTFILQLHFRTCTLFLLLE